VKWPPLSDASNLGCFNDHWMALLTFFIRCFVNVYKRRASGSWGSPCLAYFNEDCVILVTLVWALMAKDLFVGGCSVPFLRKTCMIQGLLHVIRSSSVRRRVL
ncbi:unnamed protein product, partial [Tuber aestivum]